MFHLLRSAPTVFCLLFGLSLHRAREFLLPTYARRSLNLGTFVHRSSTKLLLRPQIALSHLAKTTLGHAHTCHAHACHRRPSFSDESMNGDDSPAIAFFDRRPSYSPIPVNSVILLRCGSLDGSGTPVSSSHTQISTFVNHHACHVCLVSPSKVKLAQIPAALSLRMSKQACPLPLRPLPWLTAQRHA
jgi:hypothetical protein